MQTRTDLDIEALMAPFRALGSKEVKRHLAVVAVAAARENQKSFQGVLRQAIGRDVTGPSSMMGGGRTGRMGGASDYTVNAVMIHAPNVDPITDETPDGKVIARVFVADAQGERGKDQFAILKYGFGEGDNIREPGGVSLSGDRIHL